MNLYAEYSKKMKTKELEWEVESQTAEKKKSWMWWEKGKQTKEGNDKKQNMKFLHLLKTYY